MIGVRFIETYLPPFRNNHVESMAMKIRDNLVGETIEMLLQSLVDIASELFSDPINKAQLSEWAQTGTYDTDLNNFILTFRECTEPFSFGGETISIKSIIKWHAWDRLVINPPEESKTLVDRDIELDWD